MKWREKLLQGEVWLSEESVCSLKKLKCRFAFSDQKYLVCLEGGLGAHSRDTQGKIQYPAFDI